MDFSGMPLLLIFSSVSVISLEMENFSLQEMLFGQCSSRSQKISVAIGKIVSISLISACSALFATYILRVPGKLVGLLGLIPIGFGVRIFLQKRNAAKSPTPPQSNGVWCSHKVLQSDLIPLVLPQMGGVLNPPLE